jgi:hypothetical protein
MIVLATAACGGRTVVVAPRTVSAAQMAQLWVDPGTRPRDLFWGVGGTRYAPPRNARYTLESKDETGFSVSYDVKDPSGLEWSAKIGDEAQTEVAVSRILWGVGYHQPPVYYLPSWQLVTGENPAQISEARFRPKLPQLDRLDEVWSWADNPYSGTRQMKGLLAILLMLNSTDLKDSNNSIYQTAQRWDGATRWFVVRDVGAALGETGKLYPRRNWLEAFEKTPFITAVSGTTVELDYDGRHQELLSMITAADIQWASRLLARLTDAQWRAAFRAANYSDADSQRFIRRIKEKIADGIALRIDRRVTSD